MANQMQPESDDQVLNSCGVFVWEVDELTRLRRFLCLGTDGGTYYIGEKELTLENAKSVTDMIENGRGMDVVDTVKEISLSGCAAKQNPSIFCLALCARFQAETAGGHERSLRGRIRDAAYEAFPLVCRIPTHVFMFVDYCKKISKPSAGWGRSHRFAISSWYTKKTPVEVAMAITKYKQRGGWSHKDLLRLSHVKDPERDEVFCYAVKGWEALKEKRLKRKAENQEETIPRRRPRRQRLDSAGSDKEDESDGKTSKEAAFQLLEGVEDLRKTDNAQTAAWLIENHGLVREHVPTELLGSTDVWMALLKKMPMTALLRNLAKMTSIGLLTTDSEALNTVTERLTNGDYLQKARIHPFSVLVALNTYKSGKGDKGKLTWDPNGQIVEALDQAFYLSFNNVPATGQRILIALDVSGSMQGAKIMNSSVTAREASAAMCLVTMKRESKCQIVGFFDQIKELSMTRDWDLPKTLTYLSGLPFGATNCSLPMQWAMKARKGFDLFLVYTDSETNCGDIQPAEALRRYRKEMKIPHAKLVVVGMTATKFSIADPKDPGMLDVVGFDSAAPEVIRNFALGLI